MRNIAEKGCLNYYEGNDQYMSLCGTFVKSSALLQLVLSNYDRTTFPLSLWE